MKLLSDNVALFTEFVNKLSNWKAGVILFLTVFSLYGITIFHDYNIDDGRYLAILPAEGSSYTEIPSVFQKAFNEIDYRPITGLLLSIEQFVFGRTPFIFHTFNLIYYFILCMSLYLGFRSFKLNINKKFILLFAILFLIHPAHANVVSSIKNRDIIVATSLSLIGALFLFHSFYSNRKRIVRLFFFLLSIFFGYLTLLTKLDAIFLYGIPIIIGVYRRDVKLKTIAVFVLSTFIVIVIARFLLKFNLATVDDMGTDHSVGFFENPLSTGDYYWEARVMWMKAFYYYVKFQIIPTNYYFYFGFNTIKITGINHWQFIVGSLLFLSSSLLCLRLFFKRQKEAIAIGIAVFIVLILPYLFFIDNVAGIIAVRYSFYASIGSCLVMAGLIEYLFKKNINYGTYVTLFIVVLFSFFTIKRSIDWKDTETLYHKDIPQLENSFIANRMLGRYYYHLADDENKEISTDEAIIIAERYFDKCTVLFDEDPVTLVMQGHLALKKNEPNQAHNYFYKVTRVDSMNTTSWAEYARFGYIVNDFNIMEYSANRILSLEPSNMQGVRIYNNALLDQDKYPEMIAFNQSIISLNDQSYVPYVYLGNMHQKINNRELAIQNFFEAFRRGYKNDELRNNLIRYANNNDLTTIKHNFPDFFE